jgi:hypothetical protein
VYTKGLQHSLMSTQRRGVDCVAKQRCSMEVSIASYGSRKAHESKSRQCRPDIAVILMIYACKFP